VRLPPLPTWRRVAAIALWALVSLGGVWTLIRLLGLERGFPLVPLIAYTPYVALASATLLIAAALLRLWTAGAGAALVAVVLGALVVPRAFSDCASPDAAARQPLDIVTSNLRFGSADPAALVDLVRDEGADVLCVQELTPQEAAQLRIAGVRDLLPHRFLIAAPHSDGSGIYARYPVHAIGTGRLDAPGFGMAHAAVRVPTVGSVELASVHPMPPTAASAIDEWTAGLEALPRATPDAGLRILAGDFNATLDHAELRDILDSGYVDAADAAGEGLVTTWPGGGVFPPPVTIDHVLADERIEVGAVSVHDVPGSDHQAVSVKLFLLRGG
jgi:endonuclease/exonuclease/phosphatase family metal-dependent hydrolase